MWPMRLEMTRDECRKCLRHLELDAYGSIVSVLRAQGPFTSEKQKLLQEIAKMLNISNERHRAEVRRAVNDEKLATIAEQLNGPNTGTDWTIEGRRTIPLLPRLSPRSIFTTLANSLSLTAAAANMRSPDRHITSLFENFTAAESESQEKLNPMNPEEKAGEDLPVDAKLCNPKNELDDSKLLEESSNSNEVEEIENRKEVIENNDADEKVTEMPKALKPLAESRKRKSPPLLPIALPNKVLVLSSDSPETVNHITVTDKTTSENTVQEPQPTIHHENVKIIPLTIEISGSKESEVLGGTGSQPLVPVNKHTSTIISACTSNANKPKTIVSFVQNKLSTKVTPVMSSDVSSTTTVNKVQTENADTQSQSDTIDIQLPWKSESTNPGITLVGRVPPIFVNINSIVSKSVSSTTTVNKVPTENADAQSQDNTIDTQSTQKSESTNSGITMIDRVPPIFYNINLNPIVSKSVSSTTTVNKVPTENAVAQSQDSTNDTQPTQKSESTNSGLTYVNRVPPILPVNINPIVSKSVSSTTTVNKVPTENADAQSQDNTNDTQPTQKSENTNSGLIYVNRVPPVLPVNTNPIVSKSVISSNTHRVMAVHPGTTVSSGPGPPQIKQATPLLAYKKWPSEQNATFNPQSTAKMSVTINSTKAVNIPHHSNTKLTAKTNVIVIQKGHAKGVTLSHAGKEVLGKVIMGGKNLCVASQHNTVSVLPHHHVSLNGDQTTTTLSSANPSNAESVKTSIKSGNTIVFNLRQDAFEKKKILSQHLDSSGVLNSEPKTVIQSRYTRLLTEDSNSDANVIDKEALAKTDASMIISTKEEKQHSKNEDVNASVNSQVVNSLDTSTVSEFKEILVKSTQLISVQDDAANDIRTRACNEDTGMLDATLEPKDANLESLQYAETVTVNHVDEHDDS